ncbi:Nucleolin [Grifola frondosa]|uniref:Nucleolin n=1 Tax=Grifola frondosa TaxID=5627 RepID=A0A1C7MRY8_GRIFR|nr:Nucleolin [Grifola frondosa]
MPKTQDSVAAVEVLRQQALDESAATLFVYGIPPQATEESLKEVFGDQVVQVRMKFTRRKRSLSYAHIVFASVEDAWVVLAKSKVQKFMLDRARLRVEPVTAMRRVERDQLFGSPMPPSRTLFIGNLPYDVGFVDIRGLFSSICDIDAVRIAVNSRNRPAGYGYADFNSVDDAMRILRHHEQVPFHISLRYLKLGYALPPQPSCSNTIFAGYFTAYRTELEILEMFSIFGPIQSVRIARYEGKAQVNSAAHIDFVEPQCARRAVEHFENNPMVEENGAQIRINFARPQSHPGGRPYSKLILSPFQGDGGLLRRYFGKHAAKIMSVGFYKGSEGCEPSGVAFINFASTEDAIVAKEALHGVEVAPGYRLNLSYARPRPEVKPQPATPEEAEKDRIARHWWLRKDFEPQSEYYGSQGSQLKQKQESNWGLLYSPNRPRL